MSLIRYLKYADGMLVYVSGQSSDDTLNRTVEIRFTNEEVVTYCAELFGNFVPTFKIRSGNTDRLFVHLPPASENMCIPVMITTMAYKNLLFVYDTFYFYIDAFHPMHLKNRTQTGYYIDQTGFNVENGIVYINNTDFPIKHKLIVNNSNFVASFKLYDPIQELLKWDVSFNNKQLTINGSAQGTYSFADHTEFEIGYTSSKLQIVIYNSEETPTVITHLVPLDTASPGIDTNFEIEAEHFEFEWWFCYKAAPEPVTVVGSTAYTDAFELVTFGEPLLTLRQYYGMKNIFSSAHTELFANTYKVGSVTVSSIYSLVIKFLESELINTMAEIISKEDVEISNVAIVSTFESLAVEYIGILSMSELIKVAEGSISTTIALLEEETICAIKTIVEEHINKVFANKIVVSNQEDRYFGLKTAIIPSVVRVMEYASVIAFESGVSVMDVLQYAVAKTTLQCTTTTTRRTFLHVVPHSVSIGVDIS